MSYWIIADGQRWWQPNRECYESRVNLSVAVRLASKLQDLGYEDVHIVGGG